MRARVGLSVHPDEKAIALLPYIVGQEIEGDIACTSCTRGRFQHMTLANTPGFVGSIACCPSCHAHHLIVLHIDRIAALPAVTVAGVFRLTGRNEQSLRAALSRIPDISPDDITFMVAVAEQNIATARV